MPVDLYALVATTIKPGEVGVAAGFAAAAKVENRFLKLSDRPGIGFEAQNALYAVMKELAVWD
jgi:hypothetical protein